MHDFSKGFIRVVPQHPGFQSLKEVPVLLWALLFAMVLKPTPSECPEVPDPPSLKGKVKQGLKS